MALAWDGFLDDERAGNVGGTFEYFDEEAQAIIIRNTDSALISTYSQIELGQWGDCVWDTNLRVGNFGLSQFVPRHLYNGEIWAVGIIPTDVEAETGRFPTPAIDAGFYLFRYKYYQDLTKYLESCDTTEQSENQIKDMGVSIKNLQEEELNKTSSIFAVGSRIICKLGMGESSKMFVGTVYLDEVDWTKDGDSTSLSGRNAIGFYLSEQTFDDTITFAGTRKSVVEDILLYSGVNMQKVFIEDDETASNPTFEGTNTLLDGLTRIFDVWGWEMQELPNGKLIIGSQTHQDVFVTKEVHEFNPDEVFTRGINQSGDGGYSRLALQSSIGATETSPAFTRTVYKDLPYFDGWSIGNRRTLYINLLADQSQADMEALADEYAKAYQYIGVNLEREIPIHPEIQSGDVLEIVGAEDIEYIKQGIVTGVQHKIDIGSGTCKTMLSIDSGGTIIIGDTVETYTAKDVNGDTRKRELWDIIKKAGGKFGGSSSSGGNVIDGGGA